MSNLLILSNDSQKGLEMTQTYKPGRGLDVGTGLIIAAQGSPQGITYREFRNAYVAIPEDNRGLLEMTGTPFIEVDGQIYAVGDDAVDLAFNTHADIHRPMAKGLIHPSDTKARPVLTAIFDALLGPPITPMEPIFFSTPADPEGNPGANIYHTKLISEILLNMGYNPKSLIEGVAISYAEAKEDKFTALCFSFGAGTTNVALTFKSLPVFTLAVAQGGDWIDAKSASASGVPTQDITVLKERGIVDISDGSHLETITDQQSREASALVTHYEHLVRTVVLTIKAYIESNPTRRVNIPEVPIILSGGTAKAINFQKLFERVWTECEVPLKAKSFRLADPVQHACCKGCWTASQIITIK